VTYLQETVRGARVHRRGLDSRQLELVTAAIAERLDEPISVSMLSSVVGLSRSYFSHAFRRSVGLTPHAHVVRSRIERAMTLMAHSEASLSEVALAVGFADQSHFSRVFRRLTGVTPAHWRRAHNGASVTPRDRISLQSPDWQPSRQAI
jgi:AraC family transcriptional regulator